MQYEEFVGQVQHRAKLATMGDAVHSIHATLLTLGERLYGKEREHLAAQLPREIGTYLTESTLEQGFALREFFLRVADREQSELPDAVYHARAVMSVVIDAVSHGEITDVLAQLPADYRELFTWEGEGGERRSAA